MICFPPPPLEGTAKVVWGFQVQADTLLMVNQPDIVGVEKLQRMEVVIDKAI